MNRLLVVLAAMLVLAPAAGAGGPTPYHAASAAPTGLHAFLLSPSEPEARYYPRTPSFAWNPVAKSGTYEFQLATSRTFSDSSVVYDYTKLTVPALSIDHQLPWMTGVPYALWAHVRWVSADGTHVTPWSDPFGFNMRWRDSDYPQQLPAPEGLIRWKPIDGATRYQVFYPDVGGSVPFETTTNVADEREFFTFHSSLGYMPIRWRVRAVRYADRSALKNGLPLVSYGPWSQVFTTVNAPQSLGALTPTDTVSDTWDHGAATQAHELTPGFAWTPSSPLSDGYIGSVGSSLYRVYIATDDHCVNVVYTGSIVGSPAWAPRVSGGPLSLPQSTTDLTDWTTAPYLVKTGGTEGNAFDAVGGPVVSNETAAKSSTSTSTSPPSVDLWDSGWPTGRFYWTVVPVEAELDGQPPAKSGAPAGGPAPELKIAYRDTAVPQDRCESGYGKAFGKVSQPVVTADGTPWVSGLSASGRMIAAASKVPAVHDSPLVAWEPAIGASEYEIQLSRTSYPWRTTWSKKTPATSTTLPLTSKDVGTWWYRVRGLNSTLPSGAQAMTWSKSVRIRVTGDQFVVVK